MTLGKTVKISRKGQIVVPQEIRQKLGIKPGMRLTITLRGKEICLLTPARYSEITRGLLKGTWGKTKEEVEKYLDKGRATWE